MRVADYVFERLVQVGVTHTYSVTGRGALFLTDAVAKNTKIDNVSTHHEQAAGYAAVAHSQFTNNLAVCLVSTGCASTNAITPVLSAWQDGIPTFFISGQNTLNETTRYTGLPIRTFGQQEADIVALVEGITKYAVMISDPNEIGIEMDKLITSALSGRKGPVWLDIPLDIQSMQVDPEKLSRLSNPIVTNDTKVPNDLKNFDSLLKDSKSPLIMIGHGVRSASAIEDLEALVKKTRIPIIFSASAVDTMGSANFGSVGSIGMMGCSRSAAKALQQADLLMILGSRMNSMTTGPEFDDFARNAKVVLIDIDPDEHNKPGRKKDLFLEMDVKNFLKQLNSYIEYQTPKEWINVCEDLRKESFELEDFMIPTDGIDLYQMSKSLSHLLPNDGILLTDSGLIELILPTNISFKSEQRCLHPVSQGAMGYALPAAIGAHYASQNKVIAVIGDGSIMMNLQELQTIRHNSVPVVIIVVNNNAYSIIRKRQAELFKGRTIGTDSSNGLSCPNFEELAKCFTIQYFKAESVPDFEEVFNLAIKIDGPVLIEVKGIENQDYIQVARKLGDNGRLQRMPIENQYPFLETNAELHNLQLKENNE